VEIAARVGPAEIEDPPPWTQWWCWWCWQASASVRAPGAPPSPSTEGPPTRDPSSSFGAHSRGPVGDTHQATRRRVAGGGPGAYRPRRAGPSHGVGADAVGRGVRLIELLVEKYPESIEERDCRRPHPPSRCGTLAGHSREGGASVPPGFRSRGAAGRGLLPCGQVARVSAPVGDRTTRSRSRSRRLVIRRLLELATKEVLQVLTIKHFTRYGRSREGIRYC
jgi:hypothetical protein